MAKLDQAKIKSEMAEPTGRRVTVGHNRQVECQGDKFLCFLHGSQIARISHDGRSATLDACGYLTTTTIAAMNDFLAAFMVAPAKASRTGGTLSVRFRRNGQWQEEESAWGDSLSFTL